MDTHSPHKQVRSDGVKQKDGEIGRDGDKQRESVKREERERADVCVPVPEISLMAAVGFYLMEGRRRAGGRCREGHSEMKR